MARDGAGERVPHIISVGTSMAAQDSSGVFVVEQIFPTSRPSPRSRLRFQVPLL
jgi:hypothetical protein